MKKFLLLLVTLISSFGFSQIIGLQQFATGFSSPVEITHPANDARLFVVQQEGLIKIVSPTGVVTSTPFLNLSSIISTGGERGLLGLAFHPNYASNGLFFVNYTNTAGNTVIARYTVSSNPNIASATGTILMTINQPYSNHNGGNIRFGPDGFLYIGMGDGGSGGDPQGYSQNLVVNSANPTRVYLGKMLRIDVNTTTGSLNYGYPATNPFVTQAGKQEIWANGLRNPWKFSFNRLNGDLWIADVGQGSIEEINKISTPLPNTGLNFGWRCFEGNTAYNTSGCTGTSAMIQPLTQYSHDNGACSITGGYVYTGTQYPNFSNNYFYTDYCDDKIRMVNNAGVVTTTPEFSGNNFSTFGENKDGDLFIAGISSGTIFKIIDSSTLANQQFENNKFSIYPNPAKNNFTVKSTAENLISNVTLFDLTGKLLLSKKLENSVENSVSVAGLSKGIYLITLNTQNGISYSDKLIIE